MTATTTVPVPRFQPLVSRLTSDAAARSVEEGSGPVVASLLDAGLYAPLREFLARSGKAFRARLCQRAFAMAGGVAAGRRLPDELPLAVEALHAGSLIVDDVEDDSTERRGAPTLHRMVGPAVALNAGNWLYFWPQHLLNCAPLSPAARMEATDRTGRCLLSCHEGQALDLTVKGTSIGQTHLREVAEAISERKSGALMGLAAALGGIAAGAKPEVVDGLDELGIKLGVGLQMLDDLSGILNAGRTDKGLEDLWLDRATWAWAFLADDLDADSFYSLRGRHREAMDAGPDAGADTMAGLLQDMRFRLEVTGPLRARRQLDACVDRVSKCVSDRGEVVALVSELKRLERGFLEAPR